MAGSRTKASVKEPAASQGSLPFCVIANWKMNKTIRDALAYVDELLPLIQDLHRTQVWISAPFTALSSLQKKLEGTAVSFGAQNMHDARSGAFTGEIAADMLVDAGCSFVLLGHSERRRIFHETDELICSKVARALEAGLTPVLCIGETLEERESGRTEEVLTRQLSDALAGVSASVLEKAPLVVAYEPVWAIGTGQSATKEIVADVHAKLRRYLTDACGASRAPIPIVYGGSVSEKNAFELASVENVHGFLIGTASLQPAIFATIVHACDDET